VADLTNLERKIAELLEFAAASSDAAKTADRR
jgi:hypothetical protein